MRIVYIIDSLASKGGAERIVSEKMNWLADHEHWDVHVITCYQNPERQPNVYPLSPNVKQTFLDIPYYSQYRYGYPKRLWVKWQLYRRLTKALRQTVMRIDPEVLVGLSYFMADVVTSIPCRAVKVIESHESRLFTQSDSGLGRSWLSRLYMRYYRNRYFKRVERQADVVVTLTQSDAIMWSKARRVEVIPNFSQFPVAPRRHFGRRRIISVGRLEWEKGYDRMLEVWQAVAPSHPDWQLDIYGEGTLEGELRQIIASRRLERVEIHPFTTAIAERYAESDLFVLTSRFEGFSLVLLEAMRTGLPSVVFNCPYGPSDVIGDAPCGFVVPDGDIAAFIEKLSLLMDSEELRQSCGAAALKRAATFSEETIMERWRKLFLGVKSEE